MNNKTNIIFSIISTAICVAVAIYSAIEEFWSTTIGFGLATILFVLLTRTFIVRYMFFVRGDDSLSLSVFDKSQIKSILRKNLQDNGFVLYDGFYVNKSAKNYDIYFTTFTGGDLKNKSERIVNNTGCDSEFLADSLKISGFFGNIDDQEEAELYSVLTNKAKNYNNPDYFNDKKRKLIILANLEDFDLRKKRTYFIGLVPLHRNMTIDTISMLEFDFGNKSVNLATRHTSNDHDSRKIIKSIFKNVIKF